MFRLWNLRDDFEGLKLMTLEIYLEATIKCKGEALGAHQAAHSQVEEALGNVQVVIRQYTHNCWIGMSRPNLRAPMEISLVPGDLKKYTPGA
jgi:hypothetical protein